MMDPVKFITFNVKGLNNPIKRKRVYSYLKNLKADIVYLQESHLSDNEHKKLKREWVGQVFASSFNTKSRGTAILINKNIPFVVTKTTSDPMGRFVFVEGQMYSECWSLLNIYAPNFDDPAFIQNIFLHIAQATGIILVGGDFNFCLDTVLDRSSNNPFSLTKAAKTTISFMKDYNLTDAWRGLHPGVRDYSFYSHPHGTHTRIDNFLLSTHQCHRVLNAQYLTRLLSDHSPLVMSIFMPDKVKTSYRWRFNPMLLKRPDFCSFIREQIAFFTLTNKHSAPNSFIFWDTLKAYLRGHIISYTKGLKKKYCAELDSIEAEIQTLEKAYQRTSSKDTYRTLVNKKIQYNNLNTYQTEKSIMRSRQKYYELGEKASKVLAWQLKTEESKRAVNGIEVAPGKISNNPTEINDAFRKYYSDLYTAQPSGDGTAIDYFLSKLNLPCLSAEDSEFVSKPFSICELTAAIKILPSHKSPGEDGFPPEFYKEFKDLLIPPLMDVLQLAREEKQFPETFSRAIVSVIHKAGKDPLKCASYRPISLLNTDYKLVTKMTSKRLETFLPRLVNPDQTGFIINRLSSNNLRRFFNIIHFAHKNKIPSIALSLDAEKAFDRLEWPYLFRVLEKFGFDAQFVDLIKSLYGSPKARIAVNGTTSDYFSIHRGNRQGCALSPALFTLALEPLAEAIRIDPKITGFEIGPTTHKISLFADDILLFLTNADSSLSRLVELLNLYSSFSGYKINLDKSEILPLSEFNKDTIQHNFPFKWSPSGIKYLGILVNKDLGNLYKLNLLRLLQRLGEDLEKWMNLPLTLLGRINAIKMNVLPKFLYMFQSLPIHVPSTFFSSLDGLIRRFIWRGKSPRIALIKLTLDYARGGLKLPNFRLYYLAAQARFLAQLFEGDLSTSWLNIERLDINETTPSDVLYKWDGKSIKTITHNPFIVHSVQTWLRLHKMFRHNGPLSPKTPLWGNRLIPILYQNRGFESWSLQGITRLEHCYKDEVFMSFQQLKDEYQLPEKDFFKYLQLRDFVRVSTQGQWKLPGMSPIEFLLHGGQRMVRTISRVYDTLLPSLPITEPERSRTRWERDLGTEIDPELWEDLCSDGVSCTLNSRYRLIQFNFLHQTYFTPSRLHGFNSSISSLCFRCGLEEGTFLHSTWHCIKLQGFWQGVCEAISQIHNITFPIDPELCLLGNFTNSNLTHSHSIKLTELLLVIAKKCIAAKWKSDLPLPIGMWLSEVKSCIPLERVTYSLRNKVDHFYKIWQPFLDYLEDLPSDLIE